MYTNKVSEKGYYDSEVVLTVYEDQFGIKPLATWNVNYVMYNNDRHIVNFSGKIPSQETASRTLSHAVIAAKKAISHAIFCRQIK